MKSCRNNDCQTEWDWEEDLKFFNCLTKKNKNRGKIKKSNNSADLDYIDLFGFQNDNLATSEVLGNIDGLDIETIKHFIFFGPPRILQFIKESFFPESYISNDQLSKSQLPKLFNLENCERNRQTNDSKDWPLLDTSVIDYVYFLYNVTKRYSHNSTPIDDCPFCGKELVNSEKSDLNLLANQDWCCNALRDIVYVARNSYIHAQKIDCLTNGTQSTYASENDISKNFSSKDTKRAVSNSKDSSMLPKIINNGKIQPISLISSKSLTKSNIKEIDKGGCKVNTYVDSKGKSYKNQMISYSLSSDFCMQQGWTLNPGRQMALKSFNNETKNKIFTFKIKRYENNSLFCVKFPDASATVFHPNGVIALTIISSENSYETSKTNSNLKVLYPSHYIITNDFGEVMGFVLTEGCGFVYYPNKTIRLAFSSYEFYELDIQGKKRKHWYWYDFSKSDNKLKNSSTDRNNYDEGIINTKINISKTTAIKKKLKDEIEDVEAAIFCPIICGVTYQMGFRMYNLHDISISYMAQARHAKFQVLPKKEMYPIQHIDINIKKYEDFLNSSHSKIKKLLKKLSSFRDSFEPKSFEMNTNIPQPPKASFDLPLININI